LALAFLAALAGLWHPWLPLLPAGAALFFVSEYSWHRFAFHAPPQSGLVLRLQHRLHYDHHTDPERLDLLFLPLWFVVPNLIVTAALLYALIPDADAVGTLIAGASIGILIYEWVHYVAHVPYRPRTSFGRWIKKYHLWHHFKNEHLWYGVTNPLFDFLFRTYARVEETGRSGTTHNLVEGLRRKAQ
jgi:hypothetical protein